MTNKSKTTTSKATKAATVTGTVRVLFSITQ